MFTQKDTIEKKHQTLRGFTLVEVMVSVSIFAIVMLIATGAVFSVVGANKKTHSLKSVMTNLNFALEAMTRDVRVGFKYSCNGGGDCATTPGNTFQFKANRDIDGDGIYNEADLNDQIEYSLSNGRIVKRILGTNSSTWSVTASEITIESLNFYVIGTGTSDGKQPKVVISLQGYSGIGSTKSNFNIQTTVSQRSIDS